MHVALSNAECRQYKAQVWVSKVRPLRGVCEAKRDQRLSLIEMTAPRKFIRRLEGIAVHGGRIGGEYIE